MRWLAVTLVVIATGVLYAPVRSMLLDQRPIYTAIESNVTVNYLLVLYLFGWSCDKLGKRIGRIKGWVVWGLGTAAIVLGLKYALGWQTWW